MRIRQLASLSPSARLSASLVSHRATSTSFMFVVCEPVETFHLEIPPGVLPAVTVLLARLSGLITETVPAAGARTTEEARGCT